MSTNKTEHILVTGASGQLGSEISEVSKKYSQWKFFFHDSSTLDITDGSAIENFVGENKITVIINCAAYTNVDGAEDEVELSDAVNFTAVENLAKVSKENGIKLIHISTDYVFNGNTFRPYEEEDATDPINIYGLSKLKGEKAMLDVNPQNSIIIRTSWVYSQFGNNFVKTMRRLFQSRESLNVIFDQVGTPTYARDLAEAILKIVPQINHQKVEIYHYSNEGVTSWFDFAKAILDIENFSCTLSPIRTEQYPTKAARPRYSVMDKTKIKNDFGISIPHWYDSLRNALNRFSE